MRAIAVAALLLACASAPAPKQPDESRRVPVNRSVPAELSAEPSKSDRPARRGPPRNGDGREVSWR